MNILFLYIVLPNLVKCCYQIWIKKVIVDNPFQGFLKDAIQQKIGFFIKFKRGRFVTRFCKSIFSGLFSRRQNMSLKTSKIQSSFQWKSFPLKLYFSCLWMECSKIFRRFIIVLPLNGKQIKNLYCLFTYFQYLWTSS